MQKNWQEQIASFDDRMRTQKNFDIIKRRLEIDGHTAYLYMINGFAKDDILEKVTRFILLHKGEHIQPGITPEEFLARYVTYTEASVSQDFDYISRRLLTGSVVLFVDLFMPAILLDAWAYPSRGIEEPDDEKVLRGAHDGFSEILVNNTALIRRRIRSEDLIMEMHTVGSRSKTFVVLAYLNEKVDRDFLQRLQHKLDNLQVNSLTMAQESLNEALVEKGWYNPFPKVRYTERPDAAAASIAEGSIVVIIDNTSSVMILPASFFDFIQDSNDYCFPPVVGTYLRFVRSFVFFITIFLTPLWYLLVENPGWIPSWLSFIQVKEPNSVPVIVQLLFFEFALAGLKLASLNTPNSLSNSFSVISALILGEFAVQAHWFVPEVIMYMGLVAVGNYAQPSYELGYAFNLCRIMLLVLIAIFDYWGMILGLLVIIWLLAVNKTVSGRSYLYPLIPFNGTALKRLFFRCRMNNKNS